MIGLGKTLLWLRHDRFWVPTEKRLAVAVAIIELAWQSDTTFLFEDLLKLLSFDRWLQIQDVFVIGGLYVGRNLKQFNPRNFQRSKLLVISPSDLSATLQDFIHTPHLLQTEHRVELTRAPVIANVVVNVWFCPKTAMIAESARSLVNFLVVGRNHPSLTGRYHFGGEKRERAGEPKRTGLSPIDSCSVSVRGVLNKGNPLLFTDVLDFIQMRRNDPAHMYQHDGLRVRSDFASHVLGIHLKVLALAVHKNHLSAGMYRCRGAGDESMTWNDYGAALNADTAKDHFHC